MNFQFRKSIGKVASVVVSLSMCVSIIGTIPTNNVFAATQKDCIIDTSIEYQKIDGFGGINHPEWTGKDLTYAQRQKVFGNGDDELGFTVLRVFVNPDSNQWYKAVPTAKFAKEHGVKVFASPWEPPAKLAESGGSNGKLHLPESNYAAYAEHLNNFGIYMKNQGVDLYAISVQNEPDFASEWTYWSTDETTNFLANYADKITSTRVMSPESFQYAPETASWVSDGGKKFYSKILNNAKAFENCDLFGTHFYGTQRDWMDFPALENCGKPIWMTEVYTDSNNDADIWPMALDVSENIHDGLVVGNMSAYVWWYIRRSYGPLKEDGTISKRGYCMAQYSKFVRPDSIRVDATEIPTDDIKVSAYKKDNQVVVVAINSGDSSVVQHFNLTNENDDLIEVERYRTSATENVLKTNNMEITDNGFWATLPAESVTTFVATVSDDIDVQPDNNGYYFYDTFENSTCDWSARGNTTVGLSGRMPYNGGNALVISKRNAVWNGVQKTLDTNIFKPGNEYNFSVFVNYLDSDATTEKFYLTLQYTDSNGNTRYQNVDTKTVTKGTYTQLSNSKFKIPSDAKDMKLIVESANKTMNFYIDEATATSSTTDTSNNSGNNSNNNNNSNTTNNSRVIDLPVSSSIDVSKYTNQGITGLKLHFSSVSTGNGACHLKNTSGDWLGSVDYNLNNSNTVTIDLSKYSNIGTLDIYTWWNSANATIDGIQLITK